MPASLVSRLPHEGNRQQLLAAGSSSADGEQQQQASVSTLRLAIGAGVTATAGYLAYRRWVQHHHGGGAGHGSPATDDSSRDLATRLATNPAYQAALLASPASSPLCTGIAIVDSAISAIATSTGLVTALPPGNHVSASVTEFVVLPDMTTAGMIELGLPVRGEMRLSTYFDAPFRTTVKLAASPSTGGGATASVRSAAAAAAESSFNATRSFNADSFRGGILPSVEGDADTTLSGTTLNETVDERRFAKTGGTELRSIPARCETSVLMTYDAVTTDAIDPAVVARDCYVAPSTASGVYYLTVVLQVVAPAEDVCLQLVLPKRSELRSPPELQRGIWGRPRGAGPTELQWNVGDVPSPAIDGDRSPTVTTPKTIECRWEYIVPPETAALVSRPNTPFAAPESSLGNTASAPWDALLPTVSLAYVAPVAASGLKIRKLSCDPVLAAAAATAEDPLVPLHHHETAATTNAAAGGRPLATTSYRTMYSQSVTVKCEL